MPQPEPAIALRGITKRFGPVWANQGIDLEITDGEVHALVGENGAGKSTLMKILAGLYLPDEGEILVRGRRRRIDGPRRAIGLGIGMVHQHFMLVGRFTVTENIILGAEPRRDRLLVDYRAAAARVRELCRQSGFDLDPGARVLDLSVGQQQRVEILKVLYRGADILVLDEPTAVLAPQEVRELLANLRALRDQGKTIIFIAHKLDEVLAVADRVTVLRRGRVVGTVAAADTTPERLAELMVGRHVLAVRRRGERVQGEPCLVVRGLGVPGLGGRRALEDVSFSVRAGEIYGVAGVEGNGQAELVEALVGLRPAATGAISIGGQTVQAPARPGAPRARFSVRRTRSLGVAYIPSDRHRQGLVLAMRAWENLILGRHRRKEYRRGPFFWSRMILPLAQAAVREFDVRLASLRDPAGSLSGGNQQKLILARELGSGPRVVVAAQPTRGLDVGATEFVENKLLEARAAGQAVLLVSADLDQLLALADRIGVLRAGRLVAEFTADASTREEIGQWMLGGGDRGR